QHPETYEQLESIGQQIATGMKASLQKLNLNFTINHIGSMLTLFFTDRPVTDFETAKTSDTALFGKYFHAMLNEGVYLAPSQFESLFFRSEERRVGKDCRYVSSQ